MVATIARRVAIALLLLSCWPAAADAALQVGDRAPDFTVQASLGGNVFTFSLKQALAKGPVVLYFYPAAFTRGCTAEAHAFAEAMPRFAALGATVIGASHDDIDKLKRFSVSECRSKFPVASADDTLISAYRVTLHTDNLLLAPIVNGRGWSDRTSYVIAPDGRIIAAFTDMSPDKHVATTLAAVQAWRQSAGGG